MEALLPPKHPASATASQASWEVRQHLQHLLLQRLLLLLLRLLLSFKARVKPAMVSRPDMASRPPPPPRSKLLLAPTAMLLLSRVLDLTPSPDTNGPQHPADLRVSAQLASPANSVSEEVMALAPATVPLRVAMASRPRPAMASRLAMVLLRLAMVPRRPAMVLLRPATVALVADMVATAETAAMALPAAVLLVVKVVDMVEAAPLVEDTAAPDMEALGGEELSFCVYG